MSKTSIENQRASELCRHTFSGATMGTRYSAQCYAPADLDHPSLAAGLERAVQAVDQEMSNWKASSDLTCLNKAGVDVWVPISANLAKVLVRATEIGRETDNAFNVGLGDLIDRRGFGPGGVGQPGMSSLPGERPHRPIGEILEVDVAQSRARKRAPVTLDLCGIAKGFGVDELGRVMDHNGIQSWLVGIDGEMRARGTKPTGSSWALAIERPEYTRREAFAVIEVTDIAIATSGDYRHWSEYEGTRTSHTMDPRTGAPLRNGIASVTVLADTCMDADAYATALMVLGDKHGVQFARRKRLNALLLVREGKGLGAIGTGCFTNG
ncbi:FAD:protein FMN transferase [Paraburkholderia azotifigens]|uniref:FAD:protein FMN transferase n=1 Tax=Paraburkholderia azotifigens TaxID=2057004 RepID=A0A5C6VJT1_9BURK|nr:FAD:protein FMN transferase [Paraburkholderia azotifigens]TXC84696.1 FAD:protein FMN transferase [Paraburkholderia azotifigens]